MLPCLVLLFAKLPENPLIVFELVGVLELLTIKESKMIAILRTAESGHDTAIQDKHANVHTRTSFLSE